MSGSTFKAAAWTGDVNDFFPRSERGVVRLGVFSANVGVVTDAKVEVLGVPFGCLSGDLKGERNGLERVVDAASILRRLAAGWTFSLDYLSGKMLKLSQRHLCIN